MRNFQLAGRSTVHAGNAMGATSHPQAGLTAFRGLRSGGPAADAASIPGSADAWATILRDPGRLGLDALLQPAIKAAEQGYVVAPRIAFDWKNGFDKLKNGTNSARYLLPHGQPAVAGDVIPQPELGQTLRAIAKNGRDAFYTGAIAEDMVETLRGIGGLHTLDDFATHTTETTVPIGTIYKGHDVWQCPPNGPGITMLGMLNILSRFELPKFPARRRGRFYLDTRAPGAPLRWH